MHGGLILSLTDTLGSLAVATKGQYMTGVSVDIGASFIKPAGKVHDVFTAEAVVDGIGASSQSFIIFFLPLEIGRAHV